MVLDSTNKKWGFDQHKNRGFHVISSAKKGWFLNVFFMGSDTGDLDELEGDLTASQPLSHRDSAGKV